LLLITLVTLGYLLVEFSFSARLVDVLAANQDPGVIHGVEVDGRLISGFAVALVFWPFFFKPTRSRLISLVLILFSTLLVMSAVYHGERQLIDYLVDQSTPEQRALAVSGSLLHQGLASGAVGENALGGLWSAQTSQSITGRAFLGVVSYLAANSTAAAAQTQALAPKILTDSMREKNGGLAGAYAAFRRSQAEVRRQYARYEAGERRYQQAMDNPGAGAEQAWQRYLSDLQRKHYGWGASFLSRHRSPPLAAPDYASKKIRQALRGKGLDLPDNWNTGDYTGFARAYAARVRSQAQRAHARELSDIAPGLSLEQFASQPRIQRAWHQRLGVSNGVTLPIGAVSQEWFNQHLFTPAVSGQVKQAISRFEAGTQTYADGQSQAKMGRAAFEAMIAPVLALLFSLTGALVHVNKSLFWLIHLIARRGFQSAVAKSGAITLICLGVLVAAPFAIHTPLTSHPTYIGWVQGMRAQAWRSPSGFRSALGGWVVDDVIRLESVAYPVFDAARTTLTAVQTQMTALNRRH